MLRRLSFLAALCFTVGIATAFSTHSLALKNSIQVVPTSTALKVTKENWTYNPFDVNDLSPLDTLLRRGVVPLGVRLFRPEKYEEAVVNYMKKERCDRATAQRNMDAFFNDPNGWVVSYGRKRDLGEDFGDINAPTGVQKRPVFSFFWGTFCFWLFFSFFPTRIAELGGVQPSLPTNGICRYPVKTVDGLKCQDADGFDVFAQTYLENQ